MLNLTDNAKGSTEIMLSNLMGQTVYAQTLTTTGTSASHLISTKNLTAGMYVVSVRIGTSVQTEKIVVSH